MPTLDWAEVRRYCSTESTPRRGELQTKVAGAATADREVSDACAAVLSAGLLAPLCASCSYPEGFKDGF